MRAGRELDRIIAQQVMGFPVTQQKREVFEAADKGTRPLAHYSTDMAAAWEVVEKMAITLIPIEGGNWFALVGGKGDRWRSPAEFMQYLTTADFTKAGAAVGESAPLVICIAAAKAIESRDQALAASQQGLTSSTEEKTDTAAEAGSAPHTTH